MQRLPRRVRRAFESHSWYRFDSSPTSAASFFSVVSSNSHAAARRFRMEGSGEVPEVETPEIVTSLVGAGRHPPKGPEKKAQLTFGEKLGLVEGARLRRARNHCRPVRLPVLFVRLRHGRKPNCDLRNCRRAPNAWPGPVLLRNIQAWAGEQVERRSPGYDASHRAVASVGGLGPSVSTRGRKMRAVRTRLACRHP